MNRWEILGLEQTDDASEIRRAYANKLRGIDVDRDPQAFIALREALEAALAGAEIGALSQDFADDECSTISAVLVQEICEPDQEEPTSGGGQSLSKPVTFPPPPAQENLERDEAFAHFAALEHFLFREGDEEQEEPADVLALVHALLKHPALDNIDDSSTMENWLAEALYHSIPRSDPIIPIVADHYRWRGEAGQLSQPRLFDILVKRCDALRLVESLADPRHKYHGAYRDLLDDKSTLGMKTVARTDEVRELLHLIRQN